MKLSRGKILAILKGVNQSRKKQKRRGKQVRKRKSASFRRKSRLNLRQKTLKRRLPQKGCGDPLTKSTSIPQQGGAGFQAAENPRDALNKITTKHEEAAIEHNASVDDANNSLQDIQQQCDGLTAHLHDLGKEVKPPRPDETDEVFQPQWAARSPPTSSGGPGRGWRSGILVAANHFAVAARRNITGQSKNGNNNNNNKSLNLMSGKSIVKPKGT